MTVTRFLLNSGFAALAAGSLTFLASPAAAQDACDLNGTNGGNNAANASNGATSTGTDALACGENANATQAGGVAIGTGSQAGGPSATNPIFASTAIGFNAQAFDNAVAIGNTAIARFGGTVTPANFGINSAVAVGAGSVGIGSNVVAIGTTSRAGTGFALNTPGAPVSGGNNITVVGGRAEANQNDATAIGGNSKSARNAAPRLDPTRR